MMEGVVNVLKPPGMTSSDAVVDIRHIFGTRRVGHTGTLDPGAAGVLPICVGRATRLFDYLVEKEKTYICAEIDWRIVHFKHWMERNEYELAGLVGFELLYIIYNNRDTLDRDERKRYFSDYEQCWRFMLKHGKMNLKRKIKFLFFARPKVLLRKERKND